MRCRSPAMRAPAAAPLSSPLLLLAAVVALALLLAVGPPRVAANPLCPPCEGGSCDVDPAECRHGIVRDHCGRQVCAKGPGQRCGGAGDILGRCGEGLFCKCHRCVGCSFATLECGLSECRAGANETAPLPESINSSALA